MAKKYKHRSLAPISPAELKDRVQRAMKEGRFQQALELAKQLAKEDPAPAQQELLRQCYLGRIQQLRTQGHSRDARTLLDHILQLGYTEPAWLEQLALELACCGDVRRALQLAQQLTDSQAVARIQAQAVDAAMLHKAAGRALLPENLQGQFDRVLQAFAQLEAGQDEAMRETLQGIGLQSPFLEWKLFLRGLQAYYQKEDTRALDNWGRLNPQRLPARLAAPFRFQIDTAFRGAQPPATQTSLQQQLDRWQSNGGLVPSLRAVQSALHAKNLPRALRLAESLVPLLRRDTPHLVGRLARCFQSAIVHFGDRSDLLKYKRLFGAPADDPELARLEALALERCDDLAEAHRYWQKYEKAVAEHPDAWPPGQADKVRALIWAHMGRNAEVAAGPDDEELKHLPPFLRQLPDRPPTLKPSAEKCFQNSLELDPDQLETYQDLFRHYQRRQQQAKAEQVARQLLRRFPEHLPTLDALADLLAAKGEHAEAIQLYQRALQVNPLERRLREKLSTAHLFHARTLAEAKRFDEARAEYQASLASRDGKSNYSLFCKWAATEFKAGNPVRAEELIQQARTQAAAGLPVAYQMVIECIRLKLPAALKKRFDQEFAAGLAEPPSGATVLAVLETAASHRQAKVKYTGQKTHEKKVLEYYDRLPPAEWSEGQLASIGRTLLALTDMKRLKKVAELGRRQFPRNPHFLLLEIDGILLPKPKTSQLWRVRTLLDQAQQLTRQLPAEEQKQIQPLLEQREAVYIASGGFRGGASFGILPDIFGGFADDDFDDDDFDDDRW